MMMRWFRAGFAQTSHSVPCVLMNKETSLADLDRAERVNALCKHAQVLLWPSDQIERKAHRLSRPDGGEFRKLIHHLLHRVGKFHHIHYYTRPWLDEPVVV